MRTYSPVDSLRSIIEKKLSICRFNTSQSVFLLYKTTPFTVQLTILYIPLMRFTATD